jgi:phospholipase/lecithinase/hemolysin
VARSAACAHAAGTDPNALYVVFSGSNDLGDILRRNPAASIPIAVGGIVAVIESFIAAGAETILWLNVPDLGLAPRSRRSGPSPPPRPVGWRSSSTAR